MSRAAQILAKMNTALRRVGPADRTIYKRVISRTGGDDLIGRKVSTGITYTDTLLDPQPVYERLSRYVVGPRALGKEVAGAASADVENQYMVTFSASAISRNDLLNENMVFLFKDTSGNEEQYVVNDYEPVALNGVDLMFITYLISMAYRK